MLLGADRSHPNVVDAASKRELTVRKALLQGDSQEGLHIPSDMEKLSENWKVMSGKRMSEIHCPV